VSTYRYANSEFGKDIEPVFVRKNFTGNPSFKGKPFTFFKRENPHTNFYDDCHEIYKQLLFAAKRSERIASSSFAAQGGELSGAFADIHPLLARAGMVVDALKQEAEAVPLIWHRFCTKKYALTPVLRGYYSPEQLDYRPLFVPGENEETERPFMSILERKDDDLARAIARAEELK
jgi:hypothetical protein